MPGEEKAKAFCHKPHSRHTTIIIVDYSNNKYAKLSCEFIIEDANTNDQK